MSRSRGGKGSATRGPRRDIVEVLSTDPTEHQPHRRTVLFDCGHEATIFSHSPKRARCLHCRGAP